MILATGITIGDLSAGIAVFVFVVGIASGVITYLLRRRAASGTTETSDADVLWDQAQKMRAELQDQLDSVTAQRDRLVEFQSAQVLPALGSIAQSLTQITEALIRLERGRDAVPKEEDSGGDQQGGRDRSPHREG